MKNEESYFKLLNLYLVFVATKSHLNLYLVFIEPRGEVVDVHALLDAHVADAGATEGYEMGTALQRLTNVAGKGADVGALGTDYANGELHLSGVEVEELELVDDEGLGLQGYVFSLAGELVGSMAIDLASGEGGGYLLDFADKTGQNGLYEFQGDVFRGVGLVDGALEVEAGCGGSELEGGDVFLGACLELVDLLGGTTDANDENPGGKGVESASVPYLEFLHTQLVAQEPAHLGNKVEGGPLEGFVEIEYLAFLFHRKGEINVQRD